MIRLIFRYFFYFFVVIFVSCTTSPTDILLHHMDFIRQQGDSDPMRALAELQTIETDVKECRNEYTYYKYLLLKTRLRDKADMMPSSSDTIEHVVEYFEKHGNVMEQIESYYYQGSVYRDLKDFPRAMRSFHKALDISDRYQVAPCMLLQNTYSQLAALYKKQQIYDEALKLAKAGCAMAEKTKTIDPIYLMDVASRAFSARDSAEAIKYSLRTLECLQQDTICRYPDVICELIERFTGCNMHKEADICLALLRNASYTKEPHNLLGAMAYYYRSYSLMDSAIAYNKKIISGPKSFSQKMEAANCLMEDYTQQGCYDSAVFYGSLYSYYVDAVFTENQYEQTSRACGEHLYAISLEKEMQAREESSRYKVRIYALIVVFLLSSLIASIIYGQKKRHFISLLLAKDKELGTAKDAIKHYDLQLQENRRLVDKQKEELAAIESELQLTERDMRLKIEEKQKQIKELVRLSLQEKASQDSATILQKFRDAAYGKERVDKSDWENLYTAVEAMYPGFRESVMTMPRNSDLGTKTAYLLKIGLSNPEIADITESSRTTVWDRVKKIRGCLGDSLDIMTS